MISLKRNIQARGIFQKLAGSLSESDIQTKLDTKAENKTQADSTSRYNLVSLGRILNYSNRVKLINGLFRQLTLVIIRYLVGFYEIYMQ